MACGPRMRRQHSIIAVDKICFSSGNRVLPHRVDYLGSICALSRLRVQEHSMVLDSAYICANPPHKYDRRCPAADAERVI
eukprot:scaffold44979_cov31-Tisochrysis_lutea.AAC.5